MDPVLEKEIQNLIDDKKGDTQRLEFILESIKNEKKVYNSDQKYLINLLTDHSKEEDILERLDFLNPKKPEKKESADKITKNSTTEQPTQESFCGKCGQRLQNNGSCPNCKMTHSSPSRIYRPIEWKSESTTLVLSIILGLFGIQGIGHFYVGKIEKGIAYLIGSFIVFGVGIVLTATGIGAIIGVPLLIVYFIMFIFQILDSRKLCRYYNDYLEEHEKRPW